jgi:hypothetical protein
MDHRHRYKKTMRLCHRHRHISGDKLYFTRFRIHTLSMRHFQWASWLDKKIVYERQFVDKMACIMYDVTRKSPLRCFRNADWLRYATTLVIG